MAALAAVIRNTSQEHCKGLFEALNITDAPNWEQPIKHVLQEAQQLKPGDLEKNPGRFRTDSQTQR